jgi:hypothetical protein
MLDVIGRVVYQVLKLCSHGLWDPVMDGYKTTLVILQTKPKLICLGAAEIDILRDIPTCGQVLNTPYSAGSIS